ncbi:MAG: toxin-antitoxin system HicB family antitoxin [Candidatus Solibacter sp.]
MSVLTIRVDDEKHARLRGLAEERGVSLNKLMDELATIALVQHDTQARFRMLAAKGVPAKGVRLLDKLDRAFAKAR